MTKAKARAEQPERPPFVLPVDAGFAQLRQAAHDLARQKYDETNGDRKQAHEILMKMMEEKPDVAEALQEVAFDTLWARDLRLCSKEQRARVARKVQNGEDAEPWSVPTTLGEGLAAKRQNMDTIYDYQFPYLAKGIGLATKSEFSLAFEKVEARHETDKRLVNLGGAIRKRIAKAGKDAVIQDIVPAEELQRLFRQAGVVT